MPTFALTTESEEAYLSSLEIFRDLLFHWRTPFSLLRTVPDTRSDRTGSPVDFLWELEEQRKRVKEGKKCPLHLCHRVKGWYSAYVTVSILTARPPAILILIWSSWGWEYETLNKTAAMDLLLSHTHTLTLFFSQYEYSKIVSGFRKTSSGFSYSGTDSLLGMLMGYICARSACFEVSGYVHYILELESALLEN